jgi:hypothetical protein
MKIKIQEGLPYVTATLTYHDQHLVLDKVILDTGSVGTVFSTDRVAVAGLTPGAHDTIHRIRGVGGSEFVFGKQLDSLALGEIKLDSFKVEIGAMAYGFDIEGIVGMDFLLKAGAVIDLAQLEVHSARVEE